MRVARPDGANHFPSGVIAMSRSRIALLLTVVVAASWCIGPVQSGGQATAPPDKELRAVIEKGINYLKSSQGKDGSFSPKLAGPGITALVVAGLLRNGIDAQDTV